MDDYKYSSPFFLLTMALAPLIDLIIDEAQFFLNKLRKNIQVFETQVDSEKTNQMGKPYETSYRTLRKSKRKLWSTPPFVLLSYQYHLKPQTLHFKNESGFEAFTRNGVAFTPK